MTGWTTPGADRWIAAIVAWDFCDPAMLGDMIASEATPPELRPVIAAIITGERKPNRRAAAKSKVPATERFHIGQVLDAIEGLRRSGNLGDLADRAALEPGDLVRRLNQYGARFYEVAEKNLGVSRETAENLVREYRAAMNNYPRV